MQRAYQRFLIAAGGGLALLVLATYLTVANAAIRVVLPDGGIVMSPAVELTGGEQPVLTIGGTLFADGME